MVIASLYPILATQYESNAIFDWNFIRALQRDFGELPHEYYVFLPYGHPPPDPTTIGRNVYIKSTMELRDFFQEFHVDIWHDFGYTQASDLISLRHLSGQHFPITVNAALPFLVNAELETYSVLSNTDVVVCTKPSIHTLIETAHQRFSNPEMPKQTLPQICTIPHGVKPERIDVDKKQDARHLLGLPEDITIVLCSIDFSENNSIDILPLIRGFHVIAKDRNDVRLIISGSDGSGSIDRIDNFLEGSALRRQVTFLPNVGEYARLLLLVAADIFISPSDTVCTDNVPQVLEAMVRGIPVIATDDKNGYIEHGRTGFKVERGCFPSSYQSLKQRFAFTPPQVESLIVSQGIVIDVQGLIENLLALIENPILRKAIGTAAIEYVSKHHQLTKTVEAYENLWSNLRQSARLKCPEASEAENQGMENSWLSLMLSPIPQIIDEDTLLCITRDGASLLETGDVVIYDEMNAVIFAPIILTILDLTQTGTCLSDITQTLLGPLDPKATEDLAPDIAYHIIWCIKQGLIRPEIDISRS